MPQSRERASDKGTARHARADGTVSRRRLDGKVALVTGASRGLGRAIAVALAQEGARVAVGARTEAEWDERLPGTIHDTVAQIEAAGGQAIAVPVDLAQEPDLDRLVTTTRGALGPIDILVNNAAVTIGGRPPAPGSDRSAAAKVVRQDSALSIADFPLKALRLHFAVNVVAA